MKNILNIPLISLVINLLLLIFVFFKTPYCNEFLGLNLLYLFFLTFVIQVLLLIFGKKNRFLVITTSVICLLDICVFIYYIKNFSYCW